MCDFASRVFRHLSDSIVLLSLQLQPSLCAEKKGRRNDEDHLNIALTMGSNELGDHAFVMAPIQAMVAFLSDVLREEKDMRELHDPR